MILHQHRCEVDEVRRRFCKILLTVSKAHR